MAHPNCHGPKGHMCAKPSGQTCARPGCGQPAGTLWTEFLCPADDEEQQERTRENLWFVADGFRNWR